MDHTSPTETRIRQRYSKEFKSEVVAQARQPHVSIASVALSHGLNANLLRRWMHDTDPSYLKRGNSLSGVSSSKPISHTPGFLPVSLPQPSSKADSQSIEIEVHKGSSMIRVKWPMQASTTCLAWLRELTK
jgi:transposase